METKVKKHKFNAIDALIIIIVVAAAAAAVLFFVNSGKTVSETTVPIEYTVEVRNIKKEFAGNFKEGERLVDAQKKYHIGEVVRCNVTPGIHVGTDLVAGTQVLSEYPNHITVELTVAANASVSGGRYVIDGGYTIAVGSQVYVRLPNFTGTGYCTKLIETGVE